MLTRVLIVVGGRVREPVPGRLVGRAVLATLRLSQQRALPPRQRTVPLSAGLSRRSGINHCTTLFPYCASHSSLSLSLSLPHPPFPRPIIAVSRAVPAGDVRQELRAQVQGNAPHLLFAVSTV